MLKVAFPMCDNYKIPVTYLLKNITNLEVIDIPIITSKTVEIGNKYSPETLCTPFKYTLGTMIECINKGADIIIQLGGGCRYGYYYALQEKIIKDLGYNIKLINLVTAGKTDIKKIYSSLKPYINKSKLTCIYHSLIAFKMVKYMDKIDFYIRQNIGFEIEKNSFINFKEKCFKEFSKTKNLIDLIKKYKYYQKEFRKIKIKKSKNNLKVGLIGELYTLMEPFANYNIEYELAKRNVEITRYTSATYLLFKKHKFMKKNLHLSKDITYQMGADASDNVIHTRNFINNKYDGIIHIKSSFCTPEISVMPILDKICKKENMPIMFLSYDMFTPKEGFNTRIEAFIDMLEMRKND